MPDVREAKVGPSWADIMSYMEERFDELINSQIK